MSNASRFLGKGKSNLRGVRQRSSLANQGDWRRLAFELLEDRRLLAVDFGDAPAPFPTLLADDGARHLVAGPFLGSTIDAEANGQPSAAAIADDEVGDPSGGITFNQVRVGQQDATVTIVVSNAPAGAKVDAWIDFNGDSNWGGTLEQILFSAPVVEGANLLTFDVPADVRLGDAFARVRLSTVGGLTPTGEAIDGEVEDLLVSIEPPSLSGGEFSQPISLGNEEYEHYRGLGVGDFDADGDSDLLATSHISGIRWIESVDGQLQTSHLIALSTVSYTVPRTVTVVDLDRDGDLDFVSTETLNGYESELSWFENDGGGQFTSHALPGYPVVFHPEQITTCDWDGDGDIDLLVSSDDNVFLFENDGNQLFTREQLRISLQSSLEDIRSVIAADFDADGDLDLAVAAADLGDNEIAWFEQRGDDYFTKHLVSNAANEIGSIKLVDMDGDGDPDIVGASVREDRLAWYENDGAGDFTMHEISEPSQYAGPQRVVPADVDGDGDVDLFTSSTSGQGLGWYENVGSAAFVPHILSLREAYTMAAADFDGDGDLDLAAAFDNLLDLPGRLAWFRNVSTSVSVTASPPATLESSDDKIVFTLHRDDLVTDELTIQFAVSGAANLGSDYALSGAVSLTADAGELTFPAGVDTVQLEIIPLPDTVLESNESIAITVLSGDDYIAKDSVTAIGTIIDDEPGDFGDAPFEYPTTQALDGAKHGNSGPTLGTSRDVEQDGQPSPDADGDDASANDDEDGLVSLDVRVGKLASSVILFVANAPAGARLDAWIDFNGDGSWNGGREKIASSVVVFNGLNEIDFDVPAEAVHGTTYARFRISSMGVLNATGAAPDGEVEDHSITILPPSETNGEFGSALALPSSYGINSLVAADLDGDGDMDIVSTSDHDAPFYGGYIAWYENNGDQTFLRHRLGSQWASVRGIAVADMDGDGSLDIVVRDTTGFAIYEYTGEAVFSERHFLSEWFGSDYSAEWVEVGDFDGDGRLDLLGVTGIESVAGVYLFRQLVDGNFQPVRIADGNFFAVSPIDIDADGDLDLVGLRGDGGANYIACFENLGLAGFVEHQLTYQENRPAYSDVVVADIDGDGDQDVIPAGAGSGWYENQGAIDFTFHSGTLFGTGSLTSADLDGDGDVDLVAAYPNTGRIISFMNDGTGEFVENTIGETAHYGTVVIPADMDGDGDLDIVASRYSSYSLYWHQNLTVLQGDYDASGVVDDADFQLWRSTYGSTTDWRADGNGNKIVDAADYSLWRDGMYQEKMTGDYDLSGVVDDLDFLLWRSTYGSTTDLRADGNGDKRVDGADYTVWRDALTALEAEANAGQGSGHQLEDGPATETEESTPGNLPNQGAAALSAVETPKPALQLHEAVNSPADTSIRPAASDQALSTFVEPEGRLPAPILVEKRTTAVRPSTTAAPLSREAMAKRPVDHGIELLISHYRWLDGSDSFQADGRRNQVEEAAKPGDAHASTDAIELFFAGLAKVGTNRRSWWR